MEKIKNFKAHFSNILADEYSFSEDQIRGYWVNKAKEEKYQEKKVIGAIVGAGEMVGATSFLVWDMFNGSDCLIPVAIAAGVGVLTTTISLIKSNPYSLEKYEEIDDAYQEEKEEFKKNNKEKKTKRKVKRR